MHRIHVPTLLLLGACVLPASTAFGQVLLRPVTQGAANIVNEGRATADDDIYTCAAAPGGSRVRPNCESETETLTFQMQQRLRIALKPPTFVGEQCSASTTTEYQQRGAIARVNGTLEIADCTAASGAFTVAVVVKDESGADMPLEFKETWQRSDAENVSFTADYPIGENVELVQVRLRGLSCTCADVTDQPIAAAGDQPDSAEAAPAAP
jgi:hypothetical protein